MAVIQIVEKYYEGLSTDVKPTGVIAGSIFRETNTRATYITYDGTNWEVADQRIRLVTEAGLYIDIPGEFDSVIEALEGLGDTVALEASLAVVDTLVDAIKEKTDALGILTETGGTLTTDGNVQNLYINNAPSGIYKPIAVNLDCTAHTAGETIVITVSYRVKSGGDFILSDTDTYAGVISPELLTIELLPTRYGVKVTIQKTVGTNRAYDWEVIYEAVP